MSTKQRRNNQMEIKTPNKRVTIIKHVVGKVRTHSDPIPNITFGIPNKIDEENAGDVIQSWAQSEEPMKFKKIMYRSFPETNVKALQSGCLNAQTQRAYALENPVLKSLYKQQFQSQRVNRKLNKLEQHEEEGGGQRVFGIRSIANNVSIQELLKSVHGDFEESDYPDRSHRPKKGRLPPAKSTNASRLLEASIYNATINNSKRNEEKIREEEKNCFKMKRFRAVESTVKAMLQQ